ncbi:MAG: hypothetical protein RBT55_14635, partial [Rhodocyclaceae bacterium]|nr:hypothetical protein [Rhodocyclaceae bacterium]
VDDLLACLTLLRAAYGGLPLHDKDEPEKPGPLAKSLRLDLKNLRLGGGHAVLNGRLLRLMGEYATASAGAVIAHHSAPLGAVLRRLREAEKRAKNKGGRDAFAITLMKRGGGATELTLPWRLDEPASGHKPTLDDTPMQVLADLCNTFARDTSRKAAYLTQGWMPHLPSQMEEEALRTLLATSLAYQLARQSGGDQIAKAQAPALADKLATLALHPRLVNTDPGSVIADVLAVAEFLARESRAHKNLPTAQEH